MDIKQENEELRKLLWLNHGCQDLYGDDGEMQCSKCVIDFKRDSVERINHNLIHAAQDNKGRCTCYVFPHNVCPVHSKYGKFYHNQ